TCPSSCIGMLSEDCSECSDSGSDPIRDQKARNSSSMCSGFGPARDTCNFPESDPVWSSFMGSGSGPARASYAFPHQEPLAWIHESEYSRTTECR
ncbi:hypothetical protein Tco_0444385, partial [Tanacetum coccineum]